ncbi:hypothetical protein [Phenylobacterium sp.]|jgi:hypothetical protein|uniref:hypothetical protein n=1 Tax=Phenylobacterium sp. TaxID=1871053 RepID=UPI0025D5719A|nr:hypothetical protein [Phenylobacterium sp.]|tara:strand:- start:1455 stop:1646 length:192 start_codon:yes stop_codon:yes gene_type:complete
MRQVRSSDPIVDLDGLVQRGEAQRHDNLARFQRFDDDGQGSVISRVLGLVPGATRQGDPGWSR